MAACGPCVHPACVSQPLRLCYVLKAVDGQRGRHGLLDVTGRSDRHHGHVAHVPITPGDGALDDYGHTVFARAKSAQIKLFVKIALQREAHNDRWGLWCHSPWVMETSEGKGEAVADWPTQRSLPASKWLSPPPLRGPW